MVGVFMFYNLLTPPKPSFKLLAAAENHYARIKNIISQDDKVTYERLLVFDKSDDFHRILIVINVFRQGR